MFTERKIAGRMEGEASRHFGGLNGWKDLKEEVGELLFRLNKFLYFHFQAGDRSLAGVIAHEIAHSWTGNLVTNSNFEHFWLNEGFTVFTERKIKGLMEKGEASRSFSALGGWKGLKYSVRDFDVVQECLELIMIFKYN